MPLPEYGGTLGSKRAAHLLRRATFGPTKNQIETFAGKTPAQAIGELFLSVLPDALPPIDPKTGQEWMTSGTTGANSKDNELEDFFLGWFLGQMLNSSLACSAREKIVYFLHTHFTTIRSKVSSSRALYFQNQLFRKFALDKGGDPKKNFKELTKKVSVDNAMIRLLDGSLNVKGSPNENYARELHELYTIGRGLEGSLPTGLPAGDYGVYTEVDVQMASRVLSGWDFDDTFQNLDIDTGLPRAKIKGSTTNASAHDNTSKTFSAHFNGNTITPLTAPNATEESALDEISQLVEQIYLNSTTSENVTIEAAKNICRKLYRFYVYHDITTDDGIDSGIIEVMAQYFIAGDFKIQPVIENLLRSQHFYENGNGVLDDNFGGLIKSPIDLVIGTLRFFEVPIPAMTDSNFYDYTVKILSDVNSMGMSFFEPYDVAGYDAYHQYPIFNRNWITPNNLANRYDYTKNLIKSIDPDLINIDLYEWTKSNFSDSTVAANDGNDFIIALANLLFPVPDNLTFNDEPADYAYGLTEKRMRYFKLQLGNFPAGYWTTIWPTLGSEEGRIVMNYLFNAMLQSPEYQLS